MRSADDAYRNLKCERPRMNSLRALTPAVVLWRCDPALAHGSPIAGVGGLYGGLIHPVLVPAHALALVALGLLISQQSQGKRLAPLMVFGMALTVALVAIAFSIGEIAAGKVLLASVAISGTLVALAFPVPILILGPLAAVTGAMIGLDSPPEVNSIGEAIVILIGIGLGGCIGLAFVVECASYLTRGWQQMGMRVLGSWIAASAMLIITVYLTR